MKKFFSFIERHEHAVHTVLAVIFGLTLIAILLWAVRARADDLVQWQHPTQRENGQALMLSEIASTIVRARNQGDSPSAAVRFTVPAPEASILAPRDPNLAGTVCYSAATLDTAGLQSVFTPEVCKTQTSSAPPPSKPLSPTGLTVS